MNTDTIVACATGAMQSGIAIIRLSGKDAITIASSLFVANDGIYVDDFEPRKLYLGVLSIKKTKNKSTNISSVAINELCLCVIFPAPHSFTGETVVEFQIHGGVFLSQLIVDACINYGCRLANPGEFSLRAFSNGKMTLAQAEGVIDTISAQSESELRASYSLASGKLSQKIDEIKKELQSICSSIEVVIDYPEEDLETITLDATRNSLNCEIKNIQILMDSYETGKIIKEGLNIAIVGKPNVGKSSLLNRLLGYERAIVTDIAGTTRDHITESITYKGVKFNFIDTAGLRQTADVVESLGVQNTLAMQKSADCVIMLVDNTFNDDDQKILSTLPNNAIIVQNKAELKIFLKIHTDLSISCKFNEGIPELKELIYTKFFDGQRVDSGEYLTHARHYSCLKSALSSLTNALSADELSFIPIDIRDALIGLGNIDGSNVSTDVTNDIFSKFCLGK